MARIARLARHHSSELSALFRRRLSTRVKHHPVRIFPSEGFGHVSAQDLFEEERLPNYHAHRFHPVHLGQVYDDRYQILAKLGFGTSSTIWLARDLMSSSGDHVAIKVCIADNSDPSESIATEIETSQFLKSIESDHPGKDFLRLPEHHFQLHGPAGTHQCLVFKPLGMDFSQLRRHFPDKCVPKQLVQQSMQILLIGLDFMHQAGVIHTDLSPSNISLGLVDSEILENIENSEIEEPSYRKLLGDRTIYMSHEMPITGDMPRLCDFGAARIGKTHTGDVMPSQYRAPEVIMDVPWDSKIDIWALGLTVWDLLQGHSLFHGAKHGILNDEQHLAEMTSLLGPPPRAFLQRNQNSRKYWDEDGNWLATTPLPEQTFETRVKSLDKNDSRLFVQFMRRVLCWLPEDRPSADELFDDAFLYQDRLGAVTT